MRPCAVGAFALLTAGSLLAVPAPEAAEWERGAGVAFAGIYSDNVCLARNDEKGKAFATLTPDVNLRGSGDRADVYLNARLQYNSLAEQNLDCPRGTGVPGIGGGFNQRYIPSGNFLANLELVDNWLTLEADASARQNAVNPLAAGGEDGLNGRGNTNIAYRYGAGAVVQRQFQRRVDFLLRYNYNEQINNAGALGDSNEHLVEGSLGMTPGTSRLTAGVNGTFREVEFDRTGRPGGANLPVVNTLSSARFQATLQLTDAWQLNGAVGREWNDFLSADDDIDGEFWDVGLRWAPNTRIVVEAGTGERFFGETPRLNVDYRHKRSRLSAGYTRTVQFPRVLRNPAFDPDDPFGPGFGELPGDPVTPPDTPVLIGQSPIVNETFNLAYRFTARRSSLALRGAESQQQRLLDQRTGRFRSVTATASRDLSSKLTFSLRVGWRDNEGSEEGLPGLFPNGFEAWTAGVDATRRIGNEATVTFAWQFRSQTSDFALNEFDENRFIIRTRFTLF